jgi:hypothetical protein
MSENADRRLPEWGRETRVWNDYPPSLLRCYANWLRTTSPTEANSWNWDYGIAAMYWIACLSDATSPPLS